MTPIGSEPLPPKGALGPTSHQDAIAASRFASARISIEPAIWSSGSSTRSSTVAGLQPATTSWRRTISPSSSLRRSGYGCALMSPRPSQTSLPSPLSDPKSPSWSELDYPHDLVASTTPASVNTSAAIWVSPSGSPSAIADATTPMTGTAMVPIAATDAGRRASAANQLT